MNIRRVSNRLHRLYGDKVSVSICKSNRSIEVTGDLDRWDDVVRACTACVSKRNGWHVVNRINCTESEGFCESKCMTEDGSLDGERPDVLVIGAGVCGCAIARELTKWNISVLLVDKEADVAMQASSRNDGEVHPGVDQKKKTLKLKYELRGNAMYPQVCKELGVPFRYNGQYVAVRGKWLRPVLQVLAIQRRLLGVKDTKVIGKKELYKAQPHLNEGYDIGLYNPKAGTVCPYGLTIAYAENAVRNGAKVALETEVKGMSCGKDGRIEAVYTNRGTVYPKVVVNAAGVFSDKIAEMAGDGFFSIHPRKGTEVILDSKIGDLTDSIVSYKDPFERSDKNTKGGGIIHTVHGNILVGPDAVETYKREDYSTDSTSIDRLFAKQKKTISKLDQRDIITYFSGVRAATFEEDFIVEKGRSTPNIVHCAGIQSPGLTAAPALAVDVAEMAVSLLGDVKENPDFDPIRKPIPSVKELPEEERDALIREDPDYGVIVCRCEEISKGEILDALRSPLCVPTLDGIKRRVRPGMGRCQGGFCGPAVTSILADFTAKQMNEITKNGGESRILTGGTK